MNTSITLCIMLLATGIVHATVLEVTNDIDAGTLFNKDGLVLIAFTAPWCGVCESIKEQFNKASEDPRFKAITFASIDISKARDISEKNRISGIPTFFFLKDGIKVHEIVGVTNTKTFGEYLSKQILDKYNL